MKKVSHAVIFLNGELSDCTPITKYVTSHSRIIAADGGAKQVVDMGYIPHVVLGDFDSISPDIRETLKNHPVDWIEYPREKNETDGELALHYAIEKGYKKITVCGIFGRRIDHVLATIFLPIVFLKQEVSVVLVDGKREIFFCQDTTKIQGEKGDLLSLIPIQGDVAGITTTGLAFPLRNETLIFGLTRGISNVFTKPVATVKVQTGNLLIIHESQ